MPTGYWTGKKRPNLINTNAAKTMFKKGSSGFIGKHTKETKLKMRLARLGVSPWNKGLKGFNAGKNHPMYEKTHTQKAKNAISIKLKLIGHKPKIHFEEKGELSSRWKGGKPHCKKCNKELSNYSGITGLCKKCSGSYMRERYSGKNNHMYGKKLSKETIRKVLRKRKISSLEIKIQQIIDKYNLPYKFVGNGKFFIERKNPDFININGKKIAIEVYARRHKENLRHISIDEWKNERIEIFANYGWKIIFIEDYETNNEKHILSKLTE